MRIPKILIGLPSTEGIRHAQCIDYFDNMTKPKGSIIMRLHLQSPAQARNMMIERALAEDCTHVFFMDDDICPMPDTLTKLYEQDLPAVGGLYCSRQYPHRPFIFEEAENEQVKYMDISDKKDQLIKVDATGLGCFLISTWPLRFMERPWIRLGEIEKDGWCDDIGFFNRLRKQKVSIYVDLSVSVGHVASTIVQPFSVDGKWKTGYRTYSNEVVLV